MRRIPIIGVTAGVDEAGRAVVADAYLRAIRSAGGLGVIITPVEREYETWYQVQGIDGLVLSGGGDVSPLLFGEEPHHGIGRVDSVRDVWEMTLCRMAVKSGRPILGICRGMQVMNVAFGGDLYQDISSRADTICHQQTSARGTTWHTVRLAEGSRLGTLLGKRIAVNSYHHQAVRRVADGMMTAAVAADGITEAIEGQAGRLVGVQWHPELLPDMRPLWTSFVEAATETK
ncbi:MAG: gamma-glutamyl-gamma-aminobutyrate hydrolase family protein [Selenomonadales bacterium]|nr:gamma-glutamyl-gamma-aminobutyrate hydrolase family protein [Selenomonadales bacterium]